MCVLTAQIMPLYSAKNFVNFGPVTPEKMGLICELFLRHGQKSGAFSRISPDTLTLDRFSKTFHHMKAAFHADDGPVRYFSISQGTLLWQQNNCENVINAD